MLIPARIKRIYATITLTRTTSAYFILALLTCLILIILQLVAHTDNSNAASSIAELLSVGNITKGIVEASNDGQKLKICNDLPFFENTTCWILVDKGRFTDYDAGDEKKVFGRRDEGNVSLQQRGWHLDDVSPRVDPVGIVDGVKVGNKVLDTQCLNSLLWLDNILRDSMKEDIVILFFQVWLLILSVIAIMMESVAHLGAALCGHVLAVSWAGYRVSNSHHLEWLYTVLIVDGACQMDLLGSWWSLRNNHTIPVIVFNALALVSMTYLSFRLFMTYTKQSLGRVGASPEIRRVYKLVSLLSVFLQLSGFFLLASTSIWISKVSTGVIRMVAYHLPLYLAGFAITAILAGPWAVIGWYSVRREHKLLFWGFCVVSSLLLGIGIAMFASPLYMYIFISWPFFATVTVTSFVLLVITVTMGLVCRMYFGVGLAHFLKVSDALTGIGFTEANFPNDDKKEPVKLESTWIEDDDDSYMSKSKPDVKANNKIRASIYSDDNKSTIHVSTTPRWAQSQKALLPSQTKFSQRLSVVSGESVANFIVGTLSTTQKQSIGRGEELHKSAVPPVPRPHMAKIGPARHSRRSRPNLSVDTGLASNQRNASVILLNLKHATQRV